MIKFPTYYVHHRIEINIIVTLYHAARNTEKIFFSFRFTLGNGCNKVIDGLKKLLLL